MHCEHLPWRVYVEAYEAPLSLRREKLALQYFTKLQSCPSNPAFECTINPKYKELFARKESAIPSFGIRMQYVLDNSNILDGNVHETVIPEVPPWTLHQPRVNLDLSNLSKKDTSSLVFVQKYNEIKDEHSYCTPIYTDGSKDNDRVGCAAIINNISIKQRLPSKASIFHAEIKAIDLALDAIDESEDGAMPLFRRFFVPKVHCSEGSLVRRFVDPKVRWSEGSLIRILALIFQKKYRRPSPRRRERNMYKF